jgi:hypothetical protein
MVDSDVAVAVVSRRGDPGRRRATAAHELGHLVIGDEYSSDLGVHASRGDREALLPSQVLTDERGPLSDVVVAGDQAGRARGSPQRTGTLRLGKDFSHAGRVHGSPGMGAAT